MRATKLLSQVLILAAITACGSDNPAPEPEPQPLSEPPVAGTLVFPENLSECTEGDPVSDSQSSILFQWISGTNTDSFTLEVTDLSSNSRNSINTENTEALLTLSRGNQYSWRVISRNTGTSETATTPTWHFYNAGEALANFAPFPAELTTPVSGAVKTTGPISLQWKGSDLDAESLSYTIFIDTNSVPATEAGTTTVENFTIALTSPGIYYWRIQSTDPSGNRSLSEISQFRVE